MEYSVLRLQKCAEDWSYHHSERLQDPKGFKEPSTEGNPSPRKLSVGGQFGKPKSNRSGQTLPKDSQSRSHSSRSRLPVWGRVPAQKEAFCGVLEPRKPHGSPGRSAGLSQSRRLIAQSAPRSLTFEEALQRFGLVHHLHGPPARRVRSGRSPATAWPGGAASPARPARQSRLGSRYSPARLASRSLPATLARPPPAPRPARRPQRPLAVRPESQPRAAGSCVACRGRSTRRRCLSTALL